MKRTAKQPAEGGKVARVAQVAARNQKGARATRQEQLAADVARLRASAERALRRAERLLEAMQAFQGQMGADGAPAAGSPHIETRRTIGEGGDHD